MAWERVTTPFEKYVFHYLPGIPVLIGLCIIFRSDIEKEWCEIRELLPSTNDALLGFTFFLILLIMVLFTVFLLAMLVDAVRHMFEYAFLTPLWSEYWIARNIQNDNIKNRKYTTPKDLERKFNIITKSHETEYFYTEFFGNVAFSLFFLWGVIYWNDILPLKSSLPPRALKPLKPTDCFILWMHLVLILRAVSAQFIWKCQNTVAGWLSWNSTKPDEIESILNLVINLPLRLLDFWATILSMVWLYYWYNKGTASPQAFHYYFIMTLVITSSFEVYLVRFRRFEETLKGGILPPFDP